MALLIIGREKESHNSCSMAGLTEFFEPHAAVGPNSILVEQKGKYIPSLNYVEIIKTL